MKDSSSSRSLKRKWTQTHPSAAQPLWKKREAYWLKQIKSPPTSWICKPGGNTAHCSSFWVPRTPSSLKHQMWFNLPLKIVPSKQRISSRLLQTAERTETNASIPYWVRTCQETDTLSWLHTLASTHCRNIYRCILFIYSVLIENHMSEFMHLHPCVSSRGM